MPLAFLAIGALFLIAGIRGTVTDQGSQPGLVTLLKGDFIGNNNFFVWMLALWVVGAIGYIPGAKGLANAFLVLIVVVMLLANNKNNPGNGFFAQFNAAIKNA